MRSVDRTKLYWALVAGVFLIFGLGCFREIANWWQFGHNGYNGSTYMRAAFNSLRFGLWGQVKYYQGYTAPPTSHYFIHHPLALHVHLVPLAAIFGRDPWVGRLVPALYSILNMGMLFVILRHYYGRIEALVGIVFYTLLPINIVFATMIDHVSGAIFWCLFSLYVYMRWRETLSRKHFWLTMFGISWAAQWEWVGYLLALLLVLHAFAAGLRRKKPFRRWQPEYTFVVVFSVVVLANAAAFLGYAWAVHGSFQDLITAFNSRSSTPNNYWTTVWNYASNIHYGRVPFVVFGLWLVHFLFRTIRGDLHLRDLLPVSFLYIQAAWSTMFPDSGVVHSYWIYYIGVAFAAAGGELAGLAWRYLESVAGWLVTTWESLSNGQMGQRSARRVSGNLRMGLFLLVLAVPIAIHAPTAWKYIEKGYVHGGIPEFDNYYPTLEEAAFASAVAEHYPRGTARFILHRGLRARTEVTYYLDAPFKRRRSLPASNSPEETDRKKVLLADRFRVRDLERLNELARNHRTIVYDRRYVAIDLTEQGGGFDAYVRVEREPSIWWSWFVNGHYPPGEWKRDPRVENVDRLFPEMPEIVARQETGEPKAKGVSWICPTGMLLTGVDIAPAGNVSGLRPLCNDWSDDAEKLPALEGLFWAAQSDTYHKRLTCSPGKAVVGFHGRSGHLVDALGITCASPTGPRELERLGPLGGKGGSSFELTCPKGSAVWRLDGHRGAAVDHVSIGCVDPESIAAPEP